MSASHRIMIVNLPVNKNHCSKETPTNVQFIERMQVDAINMVGVDGRCCVARTAMDAKKRGYEVRLYLDSVAVTNDKFFLKELPKMQEARIAIVIRLSAIYRESELYVVPTVLQGYFSSSL